MSVVTRFHRDGYERIQDVEDIIERNKRRQSEPQDRKSSFRHIAEIPNIFIEQWLREAWQSGNHGIKWTSPEFDALVEKKLRDPDWKWLRADN